ncbi:MAG: hypothetical protein K2X46_16745 [Roseomonas sp.]|nr:hypothetical protein [Roseomonas sp.]
MGNDEDEGNSFLERLGRLKQHHSAGMRARHKPILLLYAMARLKHDGVERISYREACGQVAPLLKRYGPPGTRARVSDPFSRLEGDGIWALVVRDRDALFAPGGNARPGALERQNAEAGFDDSTLTLLRRKPALIDAAARVLLDANFSATDHDRVLRDVGLQLA